MNDQGEIIFSVTNRDPKPDAKTYELSTVSEIFDAVTEENLPSFIRDFEASLRTGIATREMTKAIAVAENLPQSAGGLTMDRFIWTDD